jgi:hypothetical protein
MSRFDRGGEGGGVCMSRFDHLSCILVSANRCKFSFPYSIKPCLICTSHEHGIHGHGLDPGLGLGFAFGTGPSFGFLLSFLPVCSNNSSSVDC